MAHRITLRSLTILSATLPYLLLSAVAAGRQHPVARDGPAMRVPQAEALYETSRLLSQRAHYRDSMQSLSAAVKLWQEAGQDQRAVEALSQVASHHMEGDRWQYALQCYKRLS